MAATRSSPDTEPNTAKVTRARARIGRSILPATRLVPWGSRLPARGPAVRAPRTTPIGAYPWETLPSVARAEHHARTLLRGATRGVRLGAVAAALGELARAPLKLHVGRVAPADARPGPEGSVGVVLAAHGERAPSRRVLVELEGALAAGLVTRALQHPAPRVTDAASPRRRRSPGRRPPSCTRRSAGRFRARRSRCSRQALGTRSRATCW